MFTITALQSGTYNVALTLPGFSTFVRDGVKISAGATVALDVVMSVEGIQQHVVVVGSRAQPRSVTESRHCLLASREQQELTHSGGAPV